MLQCSPMMSTLVATFKLTMAWYYTGLVYLCLTILVISDEIRARYFVLDQLLYDQLYSGI